MQARIYSISENQKDKITLLPSDKMGEATTFFEYYNPINYVTFEDGGLNFYNSNTRLYENGEYVGYISDSVSDGNSNISVSITMSFTGYVDVPSISIAFWQNYCTELNIKLYKYDNTLIYDSGTIENTNMIFTQDLSNFSNISSLIITFLKTQHPNSLVKISAIELGTITDLQGFRSFNILEETNAISSDCSVDSCDFVAISNGDPSGGQIVTLTNKDKFYGKFYINETERMGKNVYRFDSYSVMSKLDDIEFFNSINSYSFEFNTSDIVQDISDTSGVKIELGSSFSNTKVYGWLPVCSCRYALLQIAWAIGAIIDDSRQDKISLIPIPTEITSTFTTDNRRIIGDSKLNKSKYISSARWIRKDYLPQASVKDLFSIEVTNANEEDGYNFYKTFDTPTYIYNVSGSHSVNWYSPSVIDVSIQNNGTKTFSGYEYVVKENIETIYNDIQLANKNELNFDNYTLYSDNISAKKSAIKKYIQSRGTITARVVLNNEKVGDLISIETAFDGTLTGIITNINIISLGYQTIADIEVLEWQAG